MSKHTHQDNTLRVNFTTLTHFFFFQLSKRSKEEKINARRITSGADAQYFLAFRIITHLYHFS